MQNIKVSVDAVVFGYDGSDLSVLLINRKIEPFQGDWALPGGLVRDEESLETAVKRELQEETGVRIDYLEQLYSFGDIDRDPRNRVISVSYFALVRPSQFELIASTDAAAAKWFPCTTLPVLAFDHLNIVQKALERLRGKVHYQPIGFNLLDQEFPFGALENLYVAILGRAIDRRNFRKKVLGFGILESTNRYIQQEKGRPGKLYQFNARKYHQLEKKGLIFDI